MRVSTSLFALLISVSVYSQNIPVTFSASADSIAVDSVLATNLSTDQSIILPGNETLILDLSSGIQNLSELQTYTRLFPNPFDNSTTLTYYQAKSGNVSITVHNLVGQEVLQSSIFLDVGLQSFKLSLNKTGIYLINIYGSNDVSIKAVCTEADESPVSISHFGFASNGSKKAGVANTGLQNEYKLGYSTDQVMHFKCFGGKYTKIITDTVKASKNYNVEFVDCTDPDGRTYSVVNIGDQIWMEENLAYLPEVNKDNNASNSEPRYYVYEYDGTNVDEAKALNMYSEFGVLYNWRAAKISCPNGWHLPTDGEWKILETYLGMSEQDLNAGNSIRLSGSVGRKLKSKIYWGVQNMNRGENSSGFNAFGGGKREHFGGFGGFGENTSYWTSSTSFSPLAYSRSLDSFDGVERSFLNAGFGIYVRCIKDD